VFGLGWTELPDYFTQIVIGNSLRCHFIPDGFSHHVRKESSRDVNLDDRISGCVYRKPYPY